MADNDNSSYHPRLCHLKIWPDFAGYGFNLHAEKGKPGQFIGKVDEGSPSEAAGLREGDRILEVNGVSVASESHAAVVTNIKSHANEAKLLVVDPDTDRYYQGRGVTVHGGMKEVQTITCPDSSSEGRSTPSTAPVSPTPSNTDGQSHSARLCHLRKWHDFQGYGFNMHAEKGKPGQYIGQVDPGSPAEAAGLREGDRLIEVNGTNVEQESHQGVVHLIKANADETKLLVLDTEADQYFKGKGITVDSSSSFVNTITCPEHTTGGSSEPVVAVPIAQVQSHSESHSESHSHSARLCHLSIWADFQGYGFNMHAEKGKPGQYIGKVDDGSPAEAAGLREGDRLIEVNGDNVEQDSHQEVVTKIKAVPNHTQLLVVDMEADAYFKSKGVTLDSSASYVNTIKCPEHKPTVNGQAFEEVNHATAVSQEYHEEQNGVTEHDTHYENVSDHEIAAKSEPTPAPEPSRPPAQAVVVDGIEFAATAKEARERMSRKKKSDPRHSQISMKDKYDLFQRL